MSILHQQLSEILGKLHYLKRMVQKFVFEANKLLRQNFLRNFEYHPQTSLLETNPSLGAGNGHAQSSDLQFLVPLLALLRVLKCNSVLDLGSGDGYVLRVAEQLGYSYCYGVEADPNLCDISRDNLSRSTILNNFFSEVTVDSFEKPIDLIYFFNPDSPINMLDVCLNLRGLSTKFILTKNQEFHSNSMFKLNVKLVFRISSYRLYRSLRNKK